MGANPPAVVSAESHIPSLPRRIWLLVIAACMSGVSAMDRQVLTMLVEPVREEFSLTDQQLGLLTGLAFALTYVLAAIPLARLADRWSRRGMVALSVSVWSGMTMLCGAAGNYWQLFLARVGVGLGEAGGSAPMQALLADNFPRSQRGLAMSIYLVGASLGVGVGLGITGWAQSEFGWRWAFVLAGLPGLVLAPLMLFTVRDVRPKAAPGQGDTVANGQPSFGQTLRTLWQIRTLPLMIMGTTLMALIGMGLLAWVPAFFMRTHDLAPLEVGAKLGTALTIGSLLGRLAGGPLLEFLGRFDLRLYLWTPMATGAIAVVLIYFALSTPPDVAFTLLGIQTFLTGLFAAPMLYMATTLAPSWARATSAAFAMLAINLVGLGAGPWLVGALSDALRPEFGEGSLRMALLFALLVYVPAALCFGLASRYFRADHDAAVAREGDCA